jgi:hypothetical protein
MFMPRSTSRQSRSLAKCEAAGINATCLRWQDQPALMDFLCSQ